ncbi:MAG TPA: ABC transporter ATP-binding protein, partial [Vicinamibacteria bacterium]
MPDPTLAFEGAVRLGAFRMEAAFTVAAGETLVIVGRSGAGKSTCLAAVAGLRRLHQGSVRLGGEVWSDAARAVHRPPEARRVGMVFQDYALFPHLSVRGNVAYGARARGRSRAEAAAAATAWMERLGLGELADRTVGHISGGQRQRVALARALAAEPRTLLLDEPFGSLDVSTRGSLRAELRAFLIGCGLPTLLVTHDPVDALAFGDRIAVMEEGRLAQVGTREELLAQPRSAFVAELAGLNLYRAELAPGEGLRQARVGAVAFQVLAEGAGGPAFLAFAPSDVTLFMERPPGSAQNAWAGTVTEVWPLSDRLRVVVDAGVVLAAEVTRPAAAALGLAPGRPVWAAVKAT